MDARQRPGDVEAVAGRTPLGLHADAPDPGGQPGELVGDVHELCIKLLVLHALQHLMEAVQSAVEAVVRPAPQASSEFSVVFSPLPGCCKKCHLSLEVLAWTVVRHVGPLGFTAAPGCMGPLGLAVLPDYDAGSDHRPGRKLAQLQLGHRVVPRRVLGRNSGLYPVEETFKPSNQLGLGDA